MSTQVGPLRLFAPGSMRPLADDLTAAVTDAEPSVPFEIRFAASGVLAEEILAGAPADIAISADRGYMEQLRAGGLVEAPQILAGNRLALIIRPALADSITGVADLGRDGVRVAIPQPDADPCGAYAVELFARAGLTARMAEKAERGEFTIVNVRGRASGFVGEGYADAGVVYATIASIFPDLIPVPLSPPFDMADRIAFTIGSVTRDGRSHPAAARSVDLLLGPIGQAILGKNGFLPPP